MADMQGSGDAELDLERGDRAGVNSKPQPHLVDDRVDVLYEEQGFAHAQWHPVETVRVRRRVITEIQTIEVTVRREEIVVEQGSAPISREALPIGRAPIPPEPIVTVLHREVPYVRLQVEPYEQVTVGVVVVDSEAPVSLTLQAEHSRAEVSD